MVSWHMAGQVIRCDGLATQSYDYTWLKYTQQRNFKYLHAFPVNTANPSCKHFSQLHYFLKPLSEEWMESCLGIPTSSTAPTLRPCTEELEFSSFQNDQPYGKTPD